jgi:hypothetical protein
MYASRITVYLVPFTGVQILRYCGTHVQSLHELTVRAPMDLHTALAMWQQQDSNGAAAEAQTSSEMAALETKLATAMQRSPI